MSQENKAEGKSKNWFVRHKFVSIALALIILMTIFALAGGDGDKQQVVKEPPIEYTVLREWNPRNIPEYVGLEVLINESDVSKENVESLISYLAGDTDMAVVKVYKDKAAWEQESTNEYTDIYKQGYLAAYTRNSSQGPGEVRWMQEEGELKELFGTSNEIN